MIRVNLQSSFAQLIYFLFLVLIDTSQADDVGIFWGKYSDEGSLHETCATGKYSYVNIAFLDTTGNGQPPHLNLAGHCNPSSNGCSTLSSGIKYCQKQGITVMLLIEKLEANPTSEEAKNVSAYLWNNFLGGNSSSRPLGDAVLDGINFIIRDYSIYWEDLARYLKIYTTQKVHLSASLDSGLFDYITVMFNNNPSCDYKDGNLNDLISSWNQWTMLKVGRIFLGLIASPNANLSGYIPVDLLNYQILPIINKWPKYAGVMLWSRYYDRETRYSDSIKSPVCKRQSLPQCDSRDINFTESFGYMSMTSFRITESEEISHYCCEVVCSNNCSCDAYAPTNYATNTGCQI